MTRRAARIVAATAVALLASVAAGCGGDDGSSTGAGRITVIAHDSFTPSDGVLEAFTTETGIAVDVVRDGDAGQLVTKAVLTAGNPAADVLFGVDNTFLSRALDADLFEPYRSPAAASIDPALLALVPGDEATPVDVGDVCVNADVRWFAERGIALPTTLDDLTRADLKGTLVVEDPGTSSPGLAFLLATISHFGDRWQQWWTTLMANDVEVQPGWEGAYNQSFSGSSGKGPRPLVVSYATSPVAEVMFADPVPAIPPTTAIASTCFRQVELAGVLRGTAHPAQARRFIDFLLSQRFQADLPTSMFVLPAVASTPLPAEFDRLAIRPTDPITMDPATIAANRESWIAAWDAIARP